MFMKINQNKTLTTHWSTQLVVMSHSSPALILSPTVHKQGYTDKQHTIP